MSVARRIVEVLMDPLMGWAVTVEDGFVVPCPCRHCCSGNTVPTPRAIDTLNFTPLISTSLPLAASHQSWQDHRAFLHRPMFTVLLLSRRWSMDLSIVRVVHEGRELALASQSTSQLIAVSFRKISLLDKYVSWSFPIQQRKS